MGIHLNSGWEGSGRWGVRGVNVISGEEWHVKDAPVRQRCCYPTLSQPPSQRLTQPLSSSPLPYTCRGSERARLFSPALPLLVPLWSTFRTGRLAGIIDSTHAFDRCDKTNSIASSKYPEVNFNHIPKKLNVQTNIFEVHFICSWRHIPPMCSLVRKEINPNLDWSAPGETRAAILIWIGQPLVIIAYMCFVRFALTSGFLHIQLVGMKCNIWPW